jgi:regulatory protein
LTPDCKSGGTPNGRQRLAIPESPPPGVPADLQSAVKKVRPIKTGGFVILPIKHKCIMEYYNNSKRPKKPMTEQQALLKLTTLCTQAEHCSQEMLDKMKKWELPEDAIARNMEFLTQKKFIDDERFARFFINDKIKYNKWGRRKVEQALWMKHIPKEISNPIFEEIEDDMYLETLLPLLKNKYKTIKAKNDYERSMKLIRFALGRGYGMDVIHKCIDKMKEEDLGDIDFEDDF